MKLNRTTTLADAAGCIVLVGSNQAYHAGRVAFRVRPAGKLHGTPHFHGWPKTWRDGQWADASDQRPYWTDPNMAVTVVSA